MSEGKVLKKMHSHRTMKAKPQHEGPSCIILIRHAEKPPEDEDKNLNERGCHRSWGLAESGLFGPKGKAKLPRPNHLFAAKPGQKKKSGRSPRSLQTLLPLATTLGLEVNAQFMRDDYMEMLDEVQKLSGVVLISWEHKVLRTIAQHLGVQNPPFYPKTEYDMAWVVLPKPAYAKEVGLPVPEDDLDPEKEEEDYGGEAAGEEEVVDRKQQARPVLLTFSQGLNGYMAKANGEDPTAFMRKWIQDNAAGKE